LLFDFGLVVNPMRRERQGIGHECTVQQAFITLSLR